MSRDADGPAGEPDQTRIMLFTGKGGVGKTTLSAATALAAAQQGRRTLVMSTDPAHSLADVVGEALPAGEPVAVAPGLDVQHLDARALLERSWHSVQQYLLQVLHTAGVDSLAAEELTVLPGAEEILSLLEVRDRARTGGYDLIVLDCAPTAETLRLLALPEALDWYMRRIWPIERRVMSAMRAPLGRAAGVPMPDGHVLDAVEGLHEDLADVRRLLTSDQATVRLVTTPDSVVLAESRRTLTSLSLYGFRVDAVIANRCFAADGADQWRQGWATAQQERLDQARQDVTPLPLLTCGYESAEPVGLESLRAVADQVYAGGDPMGLPQVAPPLVLERLGDQIVVALRLPLADKNEMELVERGGELIVTAGAYRRVIALPSLLQRYEVAGAGLVDGVLRVRFRA